MGSIEAVASEGQYHGVYEIAPTRMVDPTTGLVFYNQQEYNNFIAI
jgi:hypothetical protein